MLYDLCVIIPPIGIFHLIRVPPSWTIFQCPPKLEIKIGLWWGWQYNYLLGLTGKTCLSWGCLQARLSVLGVLCMQMCLPQGPHKQKIYLSWGRKTEGLGGAFTNFFHALHHHDVRGEGVAGWCFLQDGERWSCAVYRTLERLWLVEVGNILWR